MCHAVNKINIWPVITSATIYVKAVILVTTGIRNWPGCRIKPGMTVDMFNCRSNNVIVDKTDKDITQPRHNTDALLKMMFLLLITRFIRYREHIIWNHILFDQMTTSLDSANGLIQGVIFTLKRFFRTPCAGNGSGRNALAVPSFLCFSMLKRYCGKAMERPYAEKSYHSSTSIRGKSILRGGSPTKPSLG